MPLPPRLLTSSKGQKRDRTRLDKVWIKARGPATWTNLDHPLKVLTGVWGRRQHSQEIPGHTTPTGLYLRLSLPFPFLPSSVPISLETRKHGKGSEAISQPQSPHAACFNLK